MPEPLPSKSDRAGSPKGKVESRQVFEPFRRVIAPGPSGFGHHENSNVRIMTMR